MNNFKGKISVKFNTWVRTTPSIYGWEDNNQGNTAKNNFATSYVLFLYSKLSFDILVN